MFLKVLVTTALVSNSAARAQTTQSSAGDARAPATQELLGVVIGRVLERCEALGNEGCCQGLGAVDLNAAAPGVIGLRDMSGHGRLLDEEMNAGAQDDSDRLAFGE